MTPDLVTALDTEILPYVIFLIVPVMGRMSDSDNDVRLLATETFATLVKLVPLEVITFFLDMFNRTRPEYLTLQVCLRNCSPRETRNVNSSPKCSME